MDCAFPRKHQQQKNNGYSHIYLLGSLEKPKKEDVTQLHNLYSTRNSLTMPKNMRYYWLVSKRNNTRKILHPDRKEMSLLKYFRLVHLKINPALKLDPDDKILELSPNYSIYSLLIQIICLKRLWFSRYRAVTYLLLQVWCFYSSFDISENWLL